MPLLLVKSVIAINWKNTKRAILEDYFPSIITMIADNMALTACIAFLLLDCTSVGYNTILIGYYDCHDI